MNILKDLLSNFCLVSVACAWIVAQIIKIFTGVFQEEKFSLLRFVCGTGGMPSSHSATVSALVVASIWQFGLASFQVAVSILLAIIVMRDATGVRLETGKQAKIINQIVPELKGDFQADLKELIGHTPLQVFVGSLLGGLVAIVLKLVAYPHI
ncbi:MAG: divergent PAP2 family protein [Clostridia bacterium]|nr:divergent PAP2 family protein [Clostridia bacterium]